VRVAAAPAPCVARNWCSLAFFVSFVNPLLTLRLRAFDRRARKEVPQRSQRRHERNRTLHHHPRQGS
jgi:hypothetical protein